MDPASRTLGETELRLLERLSALLTSLDRPADVLERLMDLFLSAMEAERGLLLRFGQAGEAQPVVLRNLSNDQVEGMRAGWSRRAVEEMAGAGQVVISDDVLNDQRFRSSESVVSQGIQSLLCVPIRSQGRVSGAIYIDHRERSRRFGEREVAFAGALAELSAVVLDRAEGLRALQEEKEALKARAGRYEYGGIIGASDAMQRLFERLERAVHAPPEAVVLVLGENGTGKTQIARLLHRESPRKERAFVTFGAGNTPETLVESELFGHRRGSFTGADQDRVGLVERAQGGTLFLDDVNALPQTVQAKLLTFLQEREYRPVGGDLRKADVRVVCASNADLEKEVQAGRFREDLYYRLNGISLSVPPLRERKEDIPLLARHFLAQYRRNMAKEIRGFTPAALTRMLGYRWPGNVRELQSEVVHATTMSLGPLVDVGDFKATELRGAGPALAAVGEGESLSLDRALDATIAGVVAAALDRHGGNVSRAAAAVGVSRGKFYTLMDRVGMRPAADGALPAVPAPAGEAEPTPRPRKRPASGS